VSGSVRARSDDGLRQAFVKGIVVVVAVFIALAGIIHLANNGHSRPEGVAEDWLASVGDTTRKGVKDESVRRAEKIGPVSLAGELLRAAGDTKGKRAFTDLEVGKAAVSGGGAGGGAAQARVPYHLHLYEQDDARDGAVVLEKQGEDWRVVAVGDRPAEEKVPSEGGAPPSSAPSVVWVAGLALGLVITALASVAVRAATPAAVS
jgi:hypothetical protein